MSHFRPGDLCMYMSRLVIIVEDIDSDWCLCYEPDVGIRKTRHDVLVMVQPL